MNDSGRQWYALQLDVVPEAVEAAEFALNSLDALGTEIDLMKKPNDSICVVGYFDEIPNEPTVQTELNYALQSYGFDESAILSVEKRAIEDTDWLAEWKRHWKPTRVDSFVIAPPWADIVDDEGIVIRIAPGMAFGTGTHETTQLCLRAIDAHYRPSESFLDIGTGTGILAIAAAKLRGRNTSGSECAVKALDIDSGSITIARENATLNRVAGLIEFEAGSITDETPLFDFVCANLTPDVIIELLPLLTSKAMRILVLSGILAGEEPGIAAALRDHGIEQIQIERAGEWQAITVRMN